MYYLLIFFFFKQKTAYDVRISDWSSDVCSSDLLIQAMLADSQAELYASESMLRDVTRRFDTGDRVSLEASCAKMFCSEMVGRIADRAVQIHGGAGYMRDSAVERFYRDVRVFRIYERSEEHTSELQSLMRISYAVFCLKKKIH